MKTKICFIAAALMFVAPAFGLEKAQTLTGGSSLKITPNAGTGGAQVAVTETRFFVENYMPDANVFRVTTRALWRAEADGRDDQSTIEAYVFPDLSKKVWSLNITGGNFKSFNEEFVQVTEGGCCGAPDLNHMINRKSGKSVVTTLDESAVEIWVPNSKLPVRYLAQVQDTKAPQKKGSKSLIGTIAYFEGQAIKGMVRVYAGLPFGWGADINDLTVIKNAKDELRRQRLDLWSADGGQDIAKAFSGIGMSGTISYEKHEEKFRILVNGDQIDSKASEATSDLELEFVTP